MKFGELLAASLISGWEAHYFDYWTLKEYIKRNTMTLEGRQQSMNHSEFFAMFKKEERRVALFVSGKLAEIVNELDFERTKYSNYNLNVAQQLGVQVIKFDRFVNDAFNAQTKILKKYRKWTGQQTHWFDESQCSMTSAKNIVHSLIVALSRLSERQWAASGITWIPPDSFVRKTVKYWVRPEHATAAKLFILQHTPILEVNETPFPPRSLDGEQTSQIHNYLSSVYMDNDKADCYHRRIALEEGANLLRVRWYGGVAGPDGLPRPDSGSIFFMELKTHHNPDVSGLKSTKERFPITAQMIPGFMSGKLSADQVIDAMVAQGQIKPGKATEQKELATFIQHFIVSLELKPWIRTVYHRTAFQRSDNNEVRISFDLPLILHPELTWNGKDWMDLFKVDNSGAAPFGYGILEVKTSEEPPAWVEELLATGWLIRVEKFSKFQHATAVFHRDAVKVLPYWINSDIAKHLATAKPDEVSELVEKSLHPNVSSLSDASTGTQPVAPLTSPTKANATNHHRVSVESSIIGGTSPLLNRNASKGKGLDSEILEPLLSLNYDGASSPQSVRSAGGKGFDDAASMRTINSKAEAAKPSMPPPPARGTNLTRMRVEPKVFFANERTFLKWMFAVVILISVSMTVMSISDKSLPFGITLLATACLLILYALGLYRWRLNRILQREGTRFDDRVGPYLMGFCLLAAACVVFVFAWKNGTEDIFVCNRQIPSCRPIDVSPVSTTVRIYGNEMIDLAIALNRLGTCLATDDSAANPNEASTAPVSRSSTKLVKPTSVVWDVNNTFLLPSTTNISDPSQAYLKHLQDLKQLVFNIRNDSALYGVVLAHLNQTIGTVSYVTRAECDIAMDYIELAAGNVMVAPTTSQQINNIFNVPFFGSGVSFIVDNELRSRYTFEKVKFGDARGTVTVLPKFANIDDRALQQQSNNVKISVDITRMADEAFSYSAVRQAQSLMQALYSPDIVQHDVQARWKQ